MSKEPKIHYGATGIYRLCVPWQKEVPASYEWSKVTCKRCLVMR